MPSVRISDFDTWRPGYGADTVAILKAGTEELADVFLDEALTIAAPNPQFLLQKTDATISYGKFAAPIYTGQAFRLRIQSIDQTGVTRPTISTLSSEDASGATVVVEGGSVASPLGEILGRIVDVRDFGDFKETGSSDASSSTNTASLLSAIGAVAATGGGFVQVPGGNYQVNGFAVPEGVIVRGRDRDGTTLQSTLAGIIATIGGDSAGFARLTLDGVSQVAQSVGISAIGIDTPILDDVRVRRFEEGIRTKGCNNHDFGDVVVSDCKRGANVRGDLDAAGTQQGGPSSQIRMTGRVELCSEYGLNIEYEDAVVEGVDVSNLLFTTNTGIAMRVRGAHLIGLTHTRFEDNTVNLDIDDDSPDQGDNLVRGFKTDHVVFEGGEIKLKGNLEDVIFERTDFRGNKITLTTPRHSVLALDCTEDFEVELAGTTSAWLRKRSTNSGSASGTTTGDVLTKAWALTMDPGQRVYLVGIAIGRGRNNNNTGFYHVAVSAERPPATLAYDTQTQNFTLGQILTGQTSKAVGRIVADTDGGATGTLRLTDVVGTFLDDEIIKDGSTGSATANGTTTFSDAVLVGSVTPLRPAQEIVTGWDATFRAVGPQIEFAVLGAAGQLVEWTVDVQVVTT